MAGWGTSSSPSLQTLCAASGGNAVAIYFGESAFWRVGDTLPQGRFDPEVGLL